MMATLEELAEMQSDDPELVPEIVPADARLSLKGPVSLFIHLLERVVTIPPLKETIRGTAYTMVEAFDSDEGVASYSQATAMDGIQTLSVKTTGLKVLRSGSALFPGKKLLEILKNAPSPIAKIEVKADTATVTAGQAVWTLSVPREDSLPPMPDVSSLSLRTYSVASFLEALTIARVSVSESRARPAFMQANISHGSMTSCDGSRISRKVLPEFPDDVDFSIPIASMDELIKALKASSSETFEYGYSGLYLVFHIDHDVLTVQRLLVSFPDVENLLLAPAISNHFGLRVDREELLEVIKRVRINADPDFYGIFLNIVPDKKYADGEYSWLVVVQAKDRNGNAAQETISGAWYGSTKSMDLCFNHKFLTDMLQSFPEDEVLLKVGESTKTQKFPILIEQPELGFTSVLQQISIRLA